MTRRLPSRTWPCCPPSRPCTSAATIRRCHCTSCTPTWRAWRARRAAHRARARQRGQQETQQRAAARQRPAPAMAGLAARLCGAAGRRRARLSRRRAFPPAPRLSSVTGKRMHGSFPIESWPVTNRDTGGSFHHEPAPCRPPIPSPPSPTPIPIPTMPRASAVPRRHAEPMGRQQSASHRAGARASAARVRPPAEPVPRGLCPGPPARCSAALSG